MATDRIDITTGSVIYVRRSSADQGHRGQLMTTLSSANGTRSATGARSGKRYCRADTWQTYTWPNATTQRFDAGER